MSDSKLMEVVGKTIAYAGKYGQRLNMEQIRRRLISAEVWGEEDIRRVIEGQRLEISDGESLNRESRRKLSMVRKIFRDRWLKFLPMVMVAVTGSVAAGNPDREDDIDLLVVTKNNRLWLTRILLKMWGRWKKIKMRSFGKEEKKDELCFNLWMEEDYLEVPQSKQTLKSATDLINMVVIMDKNEVEQKMLLSNQWANGYLATGMRERKKKISRRSSKKSDNWLADGLNWWAYWIQYWRMKERITLETVGLHQAFYHPNG
jgi:hypothetical protein